MPIFTQNSSAYSS